MQARYRCATWLGIKWESKARFSPFVASYHPSLVVDVRNKQGATIIEVDVKAVE